MDLCCRHHPLTVPVSSVIIRMFTPTNHLDLRGGHMTMMMASGVKTEFASVNTTEIQAENVCSAAGQGVIPHPMMCAR